VMGSFLALGECMVEIAPAEGGLCRQGFAGDTFNAAWYARRALPGAWTVDYATQVGRDAVSDAMLAFMAGEGIGTGSILRREDRTVGLYLLSLKDGERSFSYWRGQSAARMLAEDPARLQIKMWFHPYGTYVAMAAMLVILVAKGLDPSASKELWLSLLVAGGFAAAFFIFRRRAA